MASRVLIGSILVFLSASFVPPGAGKEVVKLPVAIDGEVPVLVRTGVANAVKSVADAFVTPEVEHTAKELAGETADRGRTFLSSLLGIGREPSDNWKAAAEKSSDQAKERFTMIDAAMRAGNARSCYVMSEVDPIATEPTHGDWLAYCLARVTGDDRRCEQIAEHRVPNIRDLCIDEFHGEEPQS